MPARLRHIAQLLLLVAAVVSASGCGRHNPQGDLVKSIRFKGNGGPLQGTADFNLRAAMEQGQSPSFAWLFPARRVSLDRETLELDAWRLETWYAHRGFFDARFRAWDVLTVRPANKRRGPLVRIVGYVETGPPSMVRSVRYEGMDVVGRPVLGLVRRQASLQEGDRFDLDAVDETADLAESRLQEQGFAFAEVTASVEAFPEEQAVDVVLTGDPGPASRFGELRLAGDYDLPERFIRDEITFSEGDPWRLSRMAETQQRLFGLGTFSLVTITPLESEAHETDDGLTAVPVRIELAESKPRQLRVGGGVAAQSARQEIHAGVGFTHVNLLDRLWRLDLDADVGFASVVTWSELPETGAAGLLEQGGPTVDLGAGLEIPRFPARRWRWNNDVGFELGVEEDYRFASPTASTGLTWQLSRRWTTRFSYRITFFDYFDSSLPDETSLLDRRGRALGLDFADPYLLSMLQQQLIYDSRDDLVFTRRGAYSVLDLAEAGGPVGGQYNFIKATADGRIWRPVPRIFGWRPRAAMTARLAGGVVLPYGSEERARVPFAERLYVGGSSSVRGWALNHLGPYIYPCGFDGNSREFTQTCTSQVSESIEERLLTREEERYLNSLSDDEEEEVYPAEYGGRFKEEELTYIGGKAALYGGVEVHGYWANNMGMAVFADVGRAWDGASVSSLDGLLTRLRQMSVAAGSGFRFLSPVGAIRLDVAVRLDDHPMFAHEDRFQVHFALSEAW